MLTWFSWKKGSEEEEEHSQKAIRADLVIILVFVSVLFWYSRSSLIDPLPFSSKESSLMFPLRAFFAVLMIAILYADLKIQPAARKTELDRYAAIGLGGGHILPYFTLQSLSTFAVYFFLSAYCVYFRDEKMHAVVNQLSMWCCIQSVTLTVMWLKLNRFEKKWQTDIYAVQEAAFPGWLRLMEFTHLWNCPISLVDLFYIQDGKNLFNFKLGAPTLVTLMIVLLVYLVVYSIILFVVYDTKGVKIYPFVAELNSIAKKAGFVGFQFAFIAVLGVIIWYSRKYTADL